MIDLKKNKTFCPFPFKGAIIEPKGEWIQPCCRWDNRAYRNKDLNDEGMININNVSNFNESWSNIRRQMLSGEKVAGCTKCYWQESNGNKSMRETAIAAIKDPIWAQGVRGPKGEWKNVTKPRLEYLEIETGRFCNLKCRTCGPGLSTSWDEDLIDNTEAQQHFFGEPHPNHNWYNEHKRNITTNEYIKDMEYDTVKHLLEVKVTGGEPFLTDAFLGFLDNLVKWDLAKNIVLDVFTNCSFFPKEKYWSILPKFKRVYINLSLDGIEQEAEFIRKKSNWKTVLKVSKHWEKLSLDYKNIFVAISHTISVFNVLSFKKFIVWVYTHFDKKLVNKYITGYTIDGEEEHQYGDFLQVTHVSGPEYLCLSNLNNKVKLKMIDDIKIQREEVDKELESIGYSDKSFVRDYAINKWYTALEKTLNGKGSDCTDLFKVKAEFFDKIRKENWQEVFPKLTEVINE